MKTTEITPFGFRFDTNEDGLISLTDLWKKAGSPNKKDPSTWQTRESTSEIIESLCLILNTPKSGVLKSKRGKSGGGTFAHKNIALSYAKWLDPKIAIAVNEVFFERVAEEKDPQLAVERAKASWKRQGKSDKWIAERMLSVTHRKSFTGTLKEHGVTGIGYKECTNAIYKPLWGGGASLVRAKKQIPDGANCRDFMTEIELAGVRLAELLAEENIEKHNAQGNAEAAFYCERASKSIAVAIIQNNGGKKI